MNIENLVEVELTDRNDFLKVKETLTRIGVLSKSQDILYQSCHILQKRGKYYIVHFKELFALDGKPTNISDNDIARRNTIANLIAEWGLVKLIVPEKTSTNIAPINQIKIISFKDKGNYQLIAKYSIGKK